MGQQSLIIVLMSSLLLSISVLGMMGMWNWSTETTATLYEREQALNISRSGVNKAVSILRKKKVWRTGFTGLRVAGGSVDVAVRDLGPDTVRITSVGTINGVSHQSIVEAKLSSIFPTVESALTVFGDSVEIANIGKSFDVDGRDWLPGGTVLGSYPPVNGIGVQSAKVVEDIKKNMDPNVYENVKGAGGEPSVGAFGSVDLTTLHKFYKDRATRTLPAGTYSYNGVFGSMADPEIVYVPGDLIWKGTIAGAGILVVDGSLKLQGNIEWEGIVLSLSGDVDIEIGGTGNPHIHGTVWVGNTSSTGITNVNITGNPSIKYSYLTLMTVLGNLGLLDVEIYKYFE